jgi:hypothetical protein
MKWGVGGRWLQAPHQASRGGAGLKAEVWGHKEQVLREAHTAGRTLRIPLIPTDLPRG